MMPVNVMAADPPVTTNNVADKLPKNRSAKTNWKEALKAEERNWPIDLEGGQRLVRVTTSDPTMTTDLNYDGTFVDAEGRTNIRLVYRENTQLPTAVWKRLLLRFDKGLFDNIDWEKSHVIAAKTEKVYGINTSNGKYEKAIDLPDLQGARGNDRYNIPINLVLKQGVNIKNLGEENYLVQARLTDINSKRIYAYAPKGTRMDYSTYTKAAGIPLKDEMDMQFYKGGPEQSRTYALQNSFFTEFIANPEKYPASSNIGIIRTQYMAQRAVLDPKDVQSGKPSGYVMMFDAGLVKYLKEDKNKNIAFTNILKKDRTPNPLQKIGIKKADINYIKDENNDNVIAYVVLATDKFKNSAVKNVVRIGTDNYDRLVNLGGMYITALDFLVDKSVFENTMETDGKNKVDFPIMTGWADSNPKGWMIYEQDFKNDFVVPAGQDFFIDTGVEPEGGTALFQLGDPDDSIIRRPQGYYNGLTDGLKGIDQFKEIGNKNGLYSLTLREGATIKTGDKLRIFLPDTVNHDADVNFIAFNNATEKDGGAATLKLQADRNINMHLYAPNKNEYFILKYTLKGETKQSELKMTRLNTWTYDDKDKILDGWPNKSVTKTGGNFWINMKKVEPSTDIFVEAYDANDNLKQGMTSSLIYNPIPKSKDRYTMPAWLDSTDNLSLITLKKSFYKPYQEVYTNNYTAPQSGLANADQINQIYIDPVSKPASLTDFMTATKSIEGFSRYDGGRVRLLHIENDGKMNISKTHAEENEYNDKGELVGKDVRKNITVEEKKYSAFPYSIDLKKFKEADDITATEGNTTINLVKDMRLLVNNSDGSSIPSDWLETRVRTRVLFDLNKDLNWTVESNGADSIVKIVPDHEKFIDEEGYMPNGFSTDSGAVLTDADGNKLTGKDREYRTWPKAPAKMEHENKTYKFLGWATGQITAEDFAKAPELETVDQWNDKTKVYRVTENSPINSHQVVYAVWGEGLKIYLHSNNGTKETVKEIVVLESAFKDGVANIDIPKAPYWNGDTVTDADMNKFIKEEEFTLPSSSKKDVRHTFVGWSTDRDDKDLLVGFNYIQLAKDNSELPDDRKNKLSQAEYDEHSFKLETLDKYTDTTTNKTTQLMLPNGYNLKLTGTYDEWLNKDYIHLYAQYRPFFEVEVNKNYKYIANENTKQASYVDSYKDTNNKVHNISDADKRQVLIGLLYRTAVTDYTDPTVHAAANYHTINKNLYQYQGYSGYDLKYVYDTKDNTTANFVLPGFDEYGQRYSYSAVETKVDEGNKYYNFKTDWADLGITIYTRFPGSGQPLVNDGPIDPANPRRNEAKIQYITIEDEDDNTFDAFTSATTRDPIKNNGKGESDIQGYKIRMFNVPRDIPKPEFDKVYDGDTAAYIDKEGIDTEHTYKGLSITLPGETEKHEYWFDSREGTNGKWKLISAPSAVVGKSVNVETVKVDGKDKIKITRTENNQLKPFNVNEQIKAEFGINNGNTNTYGPEGSTTVLSKDKNIPVKDITQEANSYDTNDKDHTNPKVTIQAKIPEGAEAGVLYEPKEGTIYTLVKDDGTPVYDGPASDTNRKPVTYTKKSSDTTNTPMYFTFKPSDNNIKDGDILRIKTVLTDKDGKLISTGKPTYSNTPVEAETPVISDASVRLRLRGPIRYEKDDTIDKKGLDYVDEDIFRRWMDLKVVMDNEDFPAYGKFEITITFEPNADGSTPDPITIKRDSKGALEETLRQLYRTDNIKNITVTAEDRLGNRNERTVEYNEPKQIVIKLVTPRDGQNKLRLRGPIGAIVTIKITRNGEEKYSQDITLTNDKFNIVDLGFDLATGDTIELEAVTKEGDTITGKSNFFKVKVR